MAIPALDGNIASLGPTIATGTGGVLLLGQGTPTDLGQQVAAVDRTTGPPLLVMADEEGGGVQRLASRITPLLPWARQMAATMSPNQVQQAAAHVAQQMAALGVNVDLAPVLDLDAGNGPNSTDADGLRSFSADPVKAAQYGLAFVAGLRQGGVLPIVKHFPGLGGATLNTDYGPANTPPLSTLRSAGLVPFQSAIMAGVPAVMMANATVPGLTNGPASLSQDAIENLLRGQLGFRGLVITDSLSAGAITAAGYDLPASAVAAIRAGADMILFGSTLTATETRLLSPANVAKSTSAIIAALVRWASGGSNATRRLDEAAQHVLSAKGVDLCP